MAKTKHNAEIDVCLLLEGTYPYVRGGVSTWVHQIITALPEVNFAIVYIGSKRKERGPVRYDLPENVLSLKEIYLFDPGTQPFRPVAKFRREWEILQSAADELSVKLGDPERKAREMSGLLLAMSELATQCSFPRFWQDRRAWNLVSTIYQRHFAGESFIDFFWTARFILEPLWRLLASEPVVPDAAVYHSVSTGYAGALGAVLSHKRQKPFLLSEHGIYVRERIAELQRARWIPSKNSLSRWRTGANPLRQLWIDFFIELGRFSYGAASEIVALFRRNADYQVEFGAPPERVRVIPNGIDPETFADLLEKREEQRQQHPERKLVGFIGRVVAIKDVKTLLRAARLTAEQLPEARFLIIGPTEEEPEYFQDCLNLWRRLELENHVTFTGPKKLDEIMPDLDVMVLSSLSEGLPFVVLESFACRIPVVTTNVGSCPDLVLGEPGEIPRLGPAGEVVKVGEPADLAAALIRLLRDRQQQDQYGNTGLERLRRYYTERSVTGQYHDLYCDLAGRGQEISQSA